MTRGLTVKLHPRMINSVLRVCDVFCSSVPRSLMLDATTLPACLNPATSCIGRKANSCFAHMIVSHTNNLLIHACTLFMHRFLLRTRAHFDLRSPPIVPPVFKHWTKVQQ